MRLSGRQRQLSSDQIKALEGIEEGGWEGGSIDVGRLDVADGVLRCTVDSNSSAVTPPGVQMASNGGEGSGGAYRQSRALPWLCLWAPPRSPLSFPAKVPRHVFVQSVSQLKIIGKQVCAANLPRVPVTI
jgi:hypothetical protein